MFAFAATQNVHKREGIILKLAVVNCLGSRASPMKLVRYHTELVFSTPPIYAFYLLSKRSQQTNIAAVPLTFDEFG